MTRQTTDTILMVRPAHFGFNAQTAANNAFQTNDESVSPEAVQRRAVEEFDDFVSRLRDAGVQVIVVEDTTEPVKPDAVFPNNWVTFHDNGQVITYPMYAPNRQLERREDVIAMLAKQFHVGERIHLEGWEARQQYLEGTGSMILDRPNKLVYACVSPRTHLEALREFCRLIGYTSVAFRAVDANGQEIYHTNVMMALGETLAVICLDAIANAAERAHVEAQLKATGKAIIAISHEQMASFAGNMLQVRNKSSETILVMSEQAYQSLDPSQIAEIAKHTKILYSPIPTIETFGGGSARCMMAEVFLPAAG